MIPGLSPTLASALGWTVFHTVVLFWPFVQAAPFLLPFAVPVAFGAGFAGLAGIAGVAGMSNVPVPPVADMPAPPVTPAPVGTAPSVSAGGSIGTSGGHAPAVSSAPAPSTISAPGGGPPGGRTGFLHPRTRSAVRRWRRLSARRPRRTSPTSRGASKAPAAAAAAAFRATDRIRTRRRQRARQHAHAHEFMDMNVDVEPEWDASTAPSDRGRGPVGVFRNAVEGSRAGDRVSDAGRRRVRWWTEHADAAEHLVAAGVKVLTRHIPPTRIGSCTTTWRRIECRRDLSGCLAGAAAATGR